MALDDHRAVISFTFQAQDGPQIVVHNENRLETRAGLAVPGRQIVRHHTPGSIDPNLVAPSVEDLSRPIHPLWSPIGHEQNTERKTHPSVLTSLE